MEAQWLESQIFRKLVEKLKKLASCRIPGKFKFIYKNDFGCENFFFNVDLWHICRKKALKLNFLKAA